MATSTLIAMSFFFMQDTFALERQEAVDLTAIAGILVDRLRRHRDAAVGAGSPSASAGSG